MRGSHACIVVLLGACAALVSGCGGGTRQDANEAEESYTVAVTRASFPARQSIVRPAVMTLRVRNTSASTMPNVAVTVDSFDYTSHYPGLAYDKRPVWVIEQGPGAIARAPVPTQAISPPGSGQTAYVNTWALGPLAPGHARTFQWRVTPVKVGTYTVHYTISAGLAGRSKARLANGAIPRGRFKVAIAPRPPAKYVNPNTGRPAPGRYPPPPYPTRHP